MKRFKTRSRKDNKKKLIIIISTIIFFVLFIWISLHTLTSKSPNLVTFLLNNFNYNHTKNTFFINKMTSHLDYLLFTPSFSSQKKMVFNEYDPLVYLYNTNDTETYYDGKSVKDANNMLYNNLKKLGIMSLVEERLPSKLSNTGLNYYDISKSFILNIQEKYPNITYYLDIHRNSVKNTTVTINNKKYAKILFVLGKDNPHWQDNQKVLEKMNKYLNDNYPGISKGILEKDQKEGNGVYNQDIHQNVLLIEIGGIENDFNEVNNSTEIIALMLYNMLGDKVEKIS